MRYKTHLFASIAVVSLITGGAAFGQTPNVWAWGNNSSGELGNGVNEQMVDRNLPVQVSSLTGIVAIAAGCPDSNDGNGGGHSLALKGDGTVWTWGYGGDGELGNGTYANSSVAVQVGGLKDVVAVSAGGYHSLALKADGTVWAWGYNGQGELGNGNADSSLPVQVSGLANVTAIAAGFRHSLALKSDGTVWAWGYNGYGELGNGVNAEGSGALVQVSGLMHVVELAAGEDHSLALNSDGTVWAWGFNGHGELGNGSNTTSDVPVQITDLSGISAIAAGGYQSMAIKSDGTAWAWGVNLGNGSNTNDESNVPAQVIGLTGVRAIAAGLEHRLALKGDGTVLAWGDNSSGELGSGNNNDSDAPAQASGLTGAIAIAGGSQYSLALNRDGTIWAWGFNGDGELGDGSSAVSNVPVSTSGLMSVVAVSGGGQALMSNGTVWAWGYNADGELGDGSNADSDVPVPVSGLTNVVAIAGGGFGGLALKTDGTVWAWGFNGYGELGNGSDASSNVPVQVSGLTNVVVIAGGGFGGLALKTDGTVWAWGDAGYGELGDGSDAGSVVPVQVSGLAGVVAVAAGWEHALALKSDGTVWAWGSNEHGELGTGSYSFDSNVPVQVKGLAGVVAIAGGNYYSLALKSDGTVWAWGADFDGDLGDGSYSDSPMPVQVSGMADVSAISAGLDNHSLALRNDGTVWAWGDDLAGELGNGSDANTTVPVQVSGLINVAAIAAGEGFTLAVVAGTIPELTLTPSSLTFAVGGAQTIKVTNSGAAPLTIGSITSMGINPGDFSISGNCANASLSPSQSCSLTVTFAPTASGSRSAALLLTANAPGSPILVPLSGTAVSSSCSYSLSQTALSPANSGGNVNITLQTGDGCSWTVSGLPDWITASPGSGSGPGIVTLTVAANTGPPRTVQISIAGISVTVSQGSDVLLVNAGGVVNGASYVGGAPVAPGSIAAVFGNFLLGSPLTDSGFPLPINLGGISLQFGSGTASPLFYASVGQINAQVPWELAGQSQTTITAAFQGQTSASQTVNLAVYAPGIFATNGGGTGQGAILDANYHLIDSTNPATAGNVVQIFCTGLGPVTNQPATGASAPGSPPAETTATPTVTIGGASAHVTFSGLAPGFVGLYQVNAQVPAAAAKGSAVPVAIAIGGAASNTVTIAVQ